MRQSTGPDNLDLPYGTGTFAISHADDPAATCGFGSDDFAGMNDAYAKVFGANPPARYVARLGVVLPDVLVSIRMTAVTG